MSSVHKPDIRQRIKELRKLKKRAVLANRKELEKNYEKHREQSELEDKIEKKQEKAANELKKMEMKERGEDYERLANMNYSIEQEEDWESKMKEKSSKDRREFQNYEQIAERSYAKSIRNDHVMGEDEYKAQKKKYDELKKKGMGEEAIRSALTSKERVQKLGESIRKKDKESYRHRKSRGGQDTEIGYINEKNRQFNEKLGRNYDKYLGELQDSMREGNRR